MDKPEELITDEQIEKAWGNGNFGEYLNNNKRELINNTVLKCASGLRTGATATSICAELGLTVSKKINGS